MLTYSLIHTPNITTSDINYLCFDNKVHLRFRDFNKEQIISGFERKLTYLLAYLFNFNFYIDALDDGVKSDKLIEQFLQTDDLREIYRIIYLNISNKKFNGFKIKCNYTKVKDAECLSFGNLAKECFPLVQNNNVYEKGSLSTFLSVLNIDLKNYLFDDSYSIIVHKIKENKISNKYKNKQLRKQLRQVSQSYEQLW